MYGKKNRQIARLKAENARLMVDNSCLRNTVLRYSVPVTLGISPVWQVTLEYAIMQTNMQGGAGREMPAGILEIISQYNPVMRMEDDENAAEQRDS